MMKFIFRLLAPLRGKAIERPPIADDRIMYICANCRRWIKSAMHPKQLTSIENYVHNLVKPWDEESRERFKAFWKSDGLGDVFMERWDFLYTQLLFVPGFGGMVYADMNGAFKSANRLHVIDKLGFLLRKHKIETEVTPHGNNYYLKLTKLH